jgi:peptidoglycan/LPS O-acetylase OafA/YrhL/lysophospholipase L1-like esterase
VTAPATATRRRIPYQPGLDGLRGAAVTAVLLYHGGVTWARGGFLGVDVFFVLSGYLITALLVAEWRERGTIGFGAFWARRARRLIPALLLVLAAVAVYAAVALAPDELGRVRGDGLAGLLYVANWHLILAKQSYFDQFLSPSPLNHLWSLGIEEQWYLVWPLLLAAGLRVARGRTQALAAGAAVMAGASAALMAVLVHPGADVSRVYFGTDTRAQSLLVGAVLALVVGVRAPAPGRDGAGSTAAAACGLAGAAVLVAMVIRARGEDVWLYRGGMTLAAVAAAAVIHAAVQPAGAVRRFLSAGPLVGLGRISYGLYLWHWPVFVALSPQRTRLTGTPLFALRAALSVGAAALSYRWVETPVRTRRRLADRRRLGAALAGAAAVVAGLLVASTLGATPTLPTASSAPGDGTAGVAAGTARPRLARPRRPPPPGHARVLLVGDSVAFSLGYNARSAVVPGISSKTGAIIGCGVVRGQQVVGGTARTPSARCEDWPNRWAADVRTFDPDVAVIMIGAWEVFDRKVGDRVLAVGTPEWQRYLLDEMETGLGIVGARGAPVVLLTVPCYSEPERQLGQPASERNDPKRVAAVNRALQALVARHTRRLHLIDLGGFLCPGGKDAGTIDGVKMRRDGVHFTPEGARVVWRWLGPQLLDVAAHPLG